MLTMNSAAASGCRRVTVPACDPVAEAAGSNPPSVNNVILKVKKGDIIDVGLDWSEWLSGNAGALLTSTWAAHPASPSSPVISGAANLIDTATSHVPVVLDLTSATVGGIYYLENTITVGPVQGGFALPMRTLKRVLHVRVIL